MKRFTFFLTLLLTFFIGATSAWAGAQDIPELSTDGAMHYYAIKNTRTGKYLYYNGDNDYLRQSYLLHHNCIFYFKAGSTTTTADGVTALKIYNLAASTAMAGFNSWTTTGNDWYVKAASHENTLGIAFGNSMNFNSKGCWNSYDSEAKIGNWDFDGGCLFTIEELNNQAVLNIFKNSLDVWKCLGYSTTNKFYNTFNNVYEQYKGDTTSSTANMITLGSAYQTFINAAPSRTTVIIGNKQHTDKYAYADDNMKASTAKDSYSYEWTLLKQPNGFFKIYSAYANKYVGSIPTSGGWNGNGDDVAMPFVENVSVAQDYYIAVGTAEGYVTFNSFQAELADNRSSLHMGNPNGIPCIVRWERSVDASNFKLTTELTDNEQAWNDAIIAKATKRSGTFVGTLNASNITPAITKLNQATDRNAKIAAFKELEAAMQATENRIAPESGKYYTINSADYTDKYWVEKYGDTGAFGGNNLYSQSLEANTVPALWQFEPCTTSGKTDLYYIKAANSGNYLSRIQWQQRPTLYIDVVEKSNSNVGVYDIFNKDVVNKENAVSFVYYTNDARTDRGTARVNAGDGKVDSWNNVATGNQFYIKEVTTIPVTITSVGYATINLPMAVTIPEGVKAYTGVKEDNVLNLTEISGSVIPAETPVVLEATAGTYNFNIKYDDATAKPENGLKGTLAPATIADGAAAYILGNGSKGVAFYKVTSTTDRTIGANKAYAGSLTEAASANVLLFNFGGNTTGINNANAANTNSNVYYDLNGRRVLYPAHGIFVKANGQKVLIK